MRVKASRKLEFGEEAMANFKPATSGKMSQNMFGGRQPSWSMVRGGVQHVLVGPIYGHRYVNGRLRFAAGVHEEHASLAKYS